MNAPGHRRSRPPSAAACRAALAALLSCGASAAQALKWDIPHRGAHVYERTTEAFEVTAPSKVRPDWVLGGPRRAGHEWLHFACPRHGVPTGFELPGFDDASWPTAPSAFGSEAGTDPRQRTPWRSEMLCLRTTIDLGQKRPRALWILADHDDGLRVWLNGRQIVANDDYGRGRNYIVTGEPLDAWQRGSNLIAAACNNVGGVQYLDLAIGVLSSLPPGVRTGEELQRQLGEERKEADRVASELFGALRTPALLLQGELDAAGQRVRVPPGDLRDLGWWLATDLTGGPLGAAMQLDAGRLFRLGDLQLRGRASAIGPDGWQTLEVTVQNTAAPAARGDSNRHVDNYVRPHIWYGFEGRLAVRRRLTIADGKARVEEFTTELTGTFLRGKDWKERPAELRQVERWKYKDTRDNQDAEFRGMVRRSLESGTQRLRQQLSDLSAENLKAQAPDSADSYHAGRLAIGLLALLKGGVPHDDEVVQRCLQELRRRPLIDTYSLGNALMAIEALYAPPNEFDALKQGTIDRPAKRRPSDEDRALMKRWTDQLLDNIDTRVDEAYLLRFNYTRGERFDHSVNQYGLLGLWSAHLCGVEISPGVWEAAANHLLMMQCPEGVKLELDLTDYRTHAVRQAEPGAVTSAISQSRTRGWSYYEPKDGGELTPTWGSMTCAGITGLAICQAALQDYAGLKRAKLQGDASRARLDGFAWLARNMTPRCHPGSIERQQRWFYYYLYGLERAALLSGIALIQDRDWYFEGAMVLVLAQAADGTWPAELLWDEGIERNAMAILFLKQSTLPVLTGR